MLHQLRYGLSQKCNWYQCVHSVFLKDCHLRQQGLSAELLVGSSCSTQKTNEILHKLSSDNTERSMSLLRKQFHVNGNLWLVDDYTTVYTKCRPDTGKLSAPKSMCTILSKVFKNIQAVTSSDPLTFHNPEAIDVTLLVNSVSGSSAMDKLACTHSSTMPSWIRSSFFDPELERSRLETHSVKSMRQMKNVNLVDFVELRLKSKEDFCFRHNASNRYAGLFEMLFFPDLEIGLPSFTQGRLFTKPYKRSTTKTAQRLSLQQLITLTTWQFLRFIHLMSQ